MKNSLANKCLTSSLVLCFLLTSTGCPLSLPELVKDINAAQVVAQSAGNILSAVNPTDGQVMLKIANELKGLSTEVSNFEKASGAAQNGIAAQIKVATDTLTADLSNILSLVNVHNPELTEYITVAVAIANSVITVVLQNLPAAGISPQSKTLAQSAALPSVPWKTHKDLKATWNNKVKVAYPKATV